MHPTDIAQLELPCVAAAAAPLHTEVQVLSAAREFCALAGEWERLDAEAASISVFNTWMWHFAWWEQHGYARGLKILVVRRAGVASGIVPLYVDRGGVLGWGLRVLRLLGTQGERNPYNVAPLFERGAEEATARTMARALLAMRGYDVLQLADTDASLPLAAAVADAARACGMRHELQRTKRLVHLQLPSSWNAYLGALSPQQRARLRHRRHSLLGAHPTRFFVSHTGVDAMLDTLALLRRTRASEALREGRLRFYCLQIDGHIAAVACAMRLRDRMAIMQTEFDPRYARWHPVSVLLHYAIEHAIDEGAKGFDFLRGQQDFDDELAPGNDQMRVTLFRSAIAAAAFRARQIFASEPIAAAT